MYKQNVETSMGVPQTLEHGYHKIEIRNKEGGKQKRVKMEKYSRHKNITRS